AVPVHQARLAGVRGQAADGVAGGVDADLLAEQAHRLRPVHQAATERAPGLVADEHDVRLAPAQVLPQVVADAAAVAHARTGDDDGAAADVVDRLRLRDLRGQVQ